MSFIDFIEKIQNKPRYIRVWILGLFVFVFMIITVSFWIISLKQSSLKFDLSNAKENVEQEKNKIIDGASSKTNISTDNKEKSLSFKEAFKASISSFFKDGTEEEPEKQIEEQAENKSGSGAINPAKLPLSN